MHICLFCTTPKCGYPEISFKDTIDFCFTFLLPLIQDTSLFRAIRYFKCLDAFRGTKVDCILHGHC